MHTWCVLALIEQATSGRLHSLNRSIDTTGRTVWQVDAEVLPTTTLADSLTFLIGRCQV
jgi:hypothetical protein